MGTTSEKLTYLNTTKEKIRDSINLTGANLTGEDTFRSYASKLKKGYIDIINNGIDTLYNNFPKVSGIGSNLSLTPTYEAPMKLNEIQGSTLQNGTPTPDTPVPIQSVTGLQNINITGKNLLPINQIQSQTINGLTITNLGDGTIKVNGTANTTTRLDVTYTKPLKANTPYIFSNANIRASSNANINIQDSDNNVLGIITLNVATNTYTPTTDVTIAKMRFYIDSGQSFDNYILKVQLEQGSTATEYEPYKGNTYEVNLGKNIWSVGNKNVSWATNYVDVKNILNTLSEGTYSMTLNFKVTEIIKEKTNNYYGFTFHNSNGHIYNKKNTNSNINVDDNFVYTYTFTISSSQVGNFTSAYFYGFGNDTDDVTARSLMYDCQLEKGSTATSYSPYFTPIELNKIGTYQDSIKKSTGKNLFDKDNTNSINAYINGNTMKFTSSGTVKTYYITCKPNTTYTIQKILSNQFRVGTSSDIPVIDGSILQFWQDNSTTQHTITTDANAKYLCICIYNSSGATITEEEVLNSVMLNEGSTALPYEPYGKVWYVEKNIGKVVLNGNENWSENGENTDYGQYSLSISNKQYGNDLLSDKFIPHTGSTGNYIWGRSTNNNIYITIAKSIISYGLATFKTWLSTHNTEVLYVLATPEYTEITNTELIEDLETLYTAKSQDGTTNISITSEDLEMILNVSALKGDA